MKDWLKCIRVKHYIKNLLICVPFLFGVSFGDYSLKQIRILILGFAAFCLVSSAIYLINDWNDRLLDRKHAVKSQRPIAAGRINGKQVLCAVILLLILAGGCCVSLPLKALLFMGIYFFLNLFYSRKLKKVVIADIVTLSFFYVLRVYYGAALVGVPVSHWLYLTVQSLALYLSIAKRLGELRDNKRAGVVTRDILEKYPEEYLSGMMNLFFGVALVFYSLWASTVLESMVITIPIVMVALMKYQYNVMAGKNSDPMEMIYKDKWLVICMFGYVCTVLLLWWQR